MSWHAPASTLERGLVYALFAPIVGIASVLDPFRKILLAVVVLDIPFQIDTNLDHLDGVAEFGGLGGFNVSLTTAALVGLYATWLLDCLVRRTRPAWPSLSLVVPLALYLAFAALSLLTAYDVELSLRELFLLVQMFLLYVYLVGSVRSWPDARFIVTLLLCGLLLESLIIVQLLRTGEGFRIAGLVGRIGSSPDDIGGGARVAGTIGSPNNAAAYLSMLLAPAAAVLVTRLGRAHKVLAALALTLGSVALIGTQSRGGWLAAGLSLTIVCVSLWRRRKLSLGVPLLLMGVVVVVSMMFQAVITQRLTGDDRGSAQSRLPLMGMAVEIISGNPVLGVGANNYSAALERNASTLRGDWLYTVHNKYLLVWAEVGIGGLVAFLWFLVATIRRGWQRWTRADPLLSPLALGFTAALMGHMVHMQVELFNGRPQIQLLWVVAALVGVMSRIDAPSSSHS